MCQIIVCGNSNNLIQFMGELNEEIEYKDSSLTEIKFSEGTTMEIDYDITEKEYWSIKYKTCGTAQYDHHPHMDTTNTREHPDVPGFSDFVELNGDIEWAEINGERFSVV